MTIIGVKVLVWNWELVVPKAMTQETHPTMTIVINTKHPRQNKTTCGGNFKQLSWLSTLLLVGVGSRLRKLLKKGLPAVQFQGHFSEAELPCSVIMLRGWGSFPR